MVFVFFSEIKNFFPVVFVDFSMLNAVNRLQNVFVSICYKIFVESHVKTMETEHFVSAIRLTQELVNNKVTLFRHLDF